MKGPQYLSCPRVHVWISAPLPVLVSDYDLKQNVKTFFKRPAILIFLEHSEGFFLGRSQSRNQGNGLRELRRHQSPLAKSFRKYKPKKQAFKRVLDLMVCIRRAQEARQFNSFCDF